MISNKQHTLAKDITLNGFGIHTGKFAAVNLFPIKENDGIIFRSNGIAQPYNHENVAGDERGTKIIISKEDEILTIEHLVAALVGMGVDNVLIDVDGPEIPIKDGSALFFAEKIKEVGLKKQQADKKILTIKDNIFLQEKDCFVLIKPADTFKINFLIDYDDEIIKTDIASFDLAKDDFIKELAGARTYGFTHELDYLIENDLAKGFDGKNAIVIDQKGYSLPLNYPNECARHKIIDFLGDIAVLGQLPLGEFFISKSGHKFNQKIVKKLSK